MLLRTVSACSRARTYHRHRQLHYLLPPLAQRATQVRGPRAAFGRSLGPGALDKAAMLASCASGHCDRNTPLVTPQELETLLPLVPRWSVSPDGKALSRKFTARNFMAAISFFQGVAEVAERESHHPDLHLTNYRDVEVVVSSHAAGGLTKFDFALASKLDEVPVDYSPKWLRENPVPE